MTTAERLNEVWEAPRILALSLWTVDHKKIGERYMMTAFAFFLLGGLIAMIIRLQLFLPNQHLVSAESYNQLFTIHGTVMIFFFATPMLSGFGNYFLPLVIGARDMAYPRLNAFGYWAFLFSGLLLFSSFLVGGAPDGGWFAYVPLTGPAYSPDVNLDFWAVSLLFLAVSTTAGAINFIVTGLKFRAPGMTISRLPLFVWAIFATSFAIIFALPPLTAANLLLLSDRQLGTHFFNPLEGGSPLLWQHLFWFFGHPDVYIIFLPAIGLVSTVIPVFARRPIVTYILIALSTMTTAFIGFGVWVHHMFAVGLPQVSLAFFSAASMLIAIPSGIQIFAWIATIWHGTPVFKTAFLFMIGFLITFVIGGITGVMFAVIPFDWQVTDSFFVVAHFHYVLFGGAVFPIFGALYYWLPKVTGRLLNEKLGILCFALIFIGFNLTFFPQHLAGLAGMPRRIYTYDSGLGWTGYNVASTVGSWLLGLGVLVFIVDFFSSLKFGKPAGNNPWGGNSLEWLTASPPPAYNFERIPIVESREPLWDQESFSYVDEPTFDERLTPETTVHDAGLQRHIPMPGESADPMIVTFGMLLIAIALLPDVVFVKVMLGAVGAVFIILGLMRWFWPSSESSRFTAAAEGVDSPGWWGMALLIVTEAVLFGSMLTGYFYIRSTTTVWPPEGIDRPELLLPALGTVLLIGSSVPMVLAELSIKRGNQRLLRAGLLGSFVLGAAFIGVQAYEYSHSEFSFTANVYTSLFFVITGLHGLHVLAGLGLNGVIQVRSWLGHFTEEHHLAVSNVAMYWHFVDVVWLFVLGTVYVSPHLLK